MTGVEQGQLHPYQRLLIAALLHIILVNKTMHVVTLLLPNTIIAMHDGIGNGLLPDPTLLQEKKSSSATAVANNQHIYA